MKYLKQLILLIAIFTSGLSMAQNKLQFGIDVFGGLANLYQTQGSTEFNPHYGVALSSGFRLNENIWLQTGLGYERKGFKTKGDETNLPIAEEVSFKSSNSYKYLFVPLNIRFCNIAGNVNYCIITGIYGAYLSKGELAVNGYYLVDNKKIPMDFTLDLVENQINLKRFDFGLNIGLQRRILTINEFVLELGVYGKLGLLRIDTSPDAKSKNYVMGINLVLNKII